MHFDTILNVTIANKQVQTVVDVRTKNESMHIGSECDITVPINCRIQYLDGKHNFLTDYPQVLFNVGDPVSVMASYLGYPTVNVFQGFVTSFDYGMPMKIKCTDYLYNLNQGVVTISNYSGSMKNLLTTVLKGTGVTLLLPVFDLPLVNITFRLMSPAAILDYLKKEIGINISLQGSQLYVNVASNTQGVVTHSTGDIASKGVRPGGNVITVNLQQPNTIFQNYRVRCWFIHDNGTRTSIDVGNEGGRMREQWFYHIPNDPGLYQKLATEALNKVKMEKFTGNIETYLYPDCQLFDLANFTSIRYPAQNGQYVITANNFEIGRGGFHRKIKYSSLFAVND